MLETYALLGNTPRRYDLKVGGVEDIWARISEIK